MIRRKLPAYGAALRDQIRAGELPLCVHLIYGYRWRDPAVCEGIASLLPQPHPLLALKPSDYAQGLFDFSLLTGLQVCVFDQEGAAAEVESLELGPVQPRYARFWFLLGELGAFAAEIEVYSRAFASGRETVDVLAFAQREMGRWPFWWSDSIEEKNAKRRATWIDVFQHITIGPRELAA